MSLFPILSLLLLRLLFTSSESYPSCLKSPSKCGNNITIKYPFILYNPETHDSHGGQSPSVSSYCGYPGLSISCEDNNTTAILHLKSDNYTVLSIDYNTSTLTLADTDILNTDDSCPRVNRNVSFDPYDWINLTNLDTNLIFFYNCSNQFRPTYGSQLQPCLGENSYVIQAIEPSEYYHLSDFCQEMVVAPILNDSDNPYNWSNGLGAPLKKGFQLHWDNGSGNCSKCEANRGQCGYNLTSDSHFVEACFCEGGKCSNQTGTATATGKKKQDTRLIIAVAVSVAIALFLVLCITLLYLRKKRNQKTHSSKFLMQSRSTAPPTDGFYKYSKDDDLEMDVDTNHMFEYKELEEATNGFRDEIGDGGFGTVYKGKLHDGRIVAIKRLYEHNYRRMEQFLNEVQILSHLRHPNLVALYGSTSRHSRELLLVYEYISNGTLADHLHGPLAEKRALTWPIRLSAAIEAAHALTYLHTVEPQIIHRDVKTNNILLDAEFHVKVADFGLSRLFPIDVTHVSTAPQGTPGYLDPEYHQCYQLTDKSDVYSFGVVLVELISSKPAVDVTRRRNEINLASMAVSKIQKCELDQLVDPWLGFGDDEVTRKMITMVAELAFRCLQHDGDMRPPIREVLEVLVGIQKEGKKLEKTNGEVEMEAGTEDDKGLLNNVIGMPLSPDSVATKWISRKTTPNTSE
ncbi:hypothetical protein LUZ60_008090 [Juncus effusus]|nr:hypothetical protein LUZ60_008090 [Juncus effusus]